MFDPERVHLASVAFLRLCGWPKGVARQIRSCIIGQNLSPIECLGLRFEHALGLAAGFDKDAKAIWGLYALGFSFIEVGTVTARPWPGNPRPRLYRVQEARALINFMGLPSAGAEVIASRLQQKPKIPIFVNVSRTPDPTLDLDAAMEDICFALELLAPLADAIVLNLSCPNTSDGKTFQEPSTLGALLGMIRKRRVCAERPFLLKLGPDLAETTMRDLVLAGLRGGAAGFVATNTTVSREGLPQGKVWPRGGLSGPPLRGRALEVVRSIRRFAGREPVIVGCGGVESHQDLQCFIEAGANLVEAFTGFIYCGPFFCRKVLRPK